MESSITDYLRKHGVSLSPKFSEGAHDHQHDWGAIEEQLKLTRVNIKDGKGKEITCKMLGTCLEAACQYRKNHNRERQDLREEVEGRKAAELLLSLQIEQPQKQLQEKKEKKTKSWKKRLR